MVYAICFCEHQSNERVILMLPTFLQFRITTAEAEAEAEANIIIKTGLFRALILSIASRLLAG